MQIGFDGFVFSQSELMREEEGLSLVPPRLSFEDELIWARETEASGV